MNKEKVEINGNYKEHYFFKDYLVNAIDGIVVHKHNLIPLGNALDSGYIKLNIGGKSYFLHRFIWESVNGPIPENKMIDHIDDNKTNNKISNLQLVTSSENNKKSAKKRDYSFVKNNHKNIKAVEATHEDGTIILCHSVYNASQKTNINPGIIKYCCENKFNVKGGVSKLDNKRWTFKYTDQVVEKPKKIKE